MLTSASGELMYMLHVLHDELEKRIEAVLTKREDISLSQYLVLVGFATGITPSLSQAKLAERLRLTEATVSRHIGILITKKLLVREKEEHNKKSYSLSLTPLGLTVFKKTEATILEVVENHFSVLSNQDKIATTATLKRVVQTITE